MALPTAVAMVRAVRLEHFAGLTEPLSPIAGLNSKGGAGALHHEARVDPKASPVFYLQKTKLPARSKPTS